MKNKVMFIAIVITVTATVTANAGVILSEYFSGNGDPLNGKTADMFSPEIVNAGGSASWVAYSSFSDDGTVIADGVGPDGRTRAYLNLGSYIDDAKGSVAGKFDLTMTMSLNSGNWLSLGFAQSNTPGGSDFTGVKGMGTIIYRDSVELDMFAGLGTAGGVDGPDNNSGARTLTVSIDVTSATGPGTVTWFDSELGHLGTAALPDSSIGSILITTPTDGCISTISDLTLTGGKIVSSAVDTPLTWTNRDPNTGEDVYVEVYCDQTNPLTTLVAEGLGISSATVDTTVLGTYYWRVDTYRDYVDESNKGPVTTGPVCYFVSVSDAPVSS
ncbi:MAG: hypothetical protein K9M75_01010, partial [Phycisphaerae bacterium]|nr:hypothetical protein [Phycisphaerae bacterium]